MPPYLLLWAKSADREDGPRWHPLPYHLLDVAAVAERLLQRSRFLTGFAEALGLDRDALPRFVLLLVALHDIGKSSGHFQWRLPEAARRLAEAGFGQPRPMSEARHGAITATYLTPEGGASRPVLDAVEACAPGLPPYHWGMIVQAVAGHHGRPVATARIAGRDLTVNTPFHAAASELAVDLAALFGEPRLPPNFLAKDVRSAAFSWFLSALLPVCDWIGSNQDWFPPRAPDLDLRSYWETVTRPAAARAIAQAGLSPVPVTTPGADITLPRLTDPTPLQCHLLRCHPPLGPALFIVEDATGSGKTEAALTLVHRLMHAGLADGFYFALPTTATADAMYRRLAEGFRKLFVEADVRASLVRVHGRVGLGGADEDRAVAAFCAEWIAEDRRKAFMAQGGAGTIDQALLTVLPAKYQSLRLYGLHGKILIVDEVHAFDSFVLEVLAKLIELHAMLGGTTILMSATLPLSTRQKLATAHQRGLGQRGISPLAGNAYPLVTTVASSGTTETPLDLAKWSKRRVAVERIENVADGERCVAELARAGCAVALIRSTVDAAIESYERLRVELGDEVELLHSRFLPEDRARIETAVLERFGKTSTPRMRRGRVLVATQVIEQSLDLDFDAIVTDLAPIDLLIQRAGRVWRHAREGRSVAAPVLRVISPTPTQADAANWLDATLQEAVWVYRDAALLWLTARHLFDAGEIVLTTLENGAEAPAHPRRLVDAVYAADDGALPTPSLRETRGRARSGALGDAEIAKYAALNAREGYGGDPRIWEAEGVTRTRLERPKRVAVRLAVERAGAFVPLAKDEKWASSEVSVTEVWAATLREPDDTQRARLKPSWSEADEGVRLLVLEASAEGYRAADLSHSYGRNTGLTHGRRRSPD